MNGLVKNSLVKMPFLSISTFRSSLLVQFSLQFVPLFPDLNHLWLSLQPKMKYSRSIYFYIFSGVGKNGQPKRKEFTSRNINDEKLIEYVRHVILYDYPRYILSSSRKNRRTVSNLTEVTGTTVTKRCYIINWGFVRLTYYTLQNEVLNPSYSWSGSKNITIVQCPSAR